MQCAKTSAAFASWRSIWANAGCWSVTTFFTKIAWSVDVLRVSKSGWRVRAFCIALREARTVLQCQICCYETFYHEKPLTITRSSKGRIPNLPCYLGSASSTAQDLTASCFTFFKQMQTSSIDATTRSVKSPSEQNVDEFILWTKHVPAWGEKRSMSLGNVRKMKCRLGWRSWIAHGVMKGFTAPPNAILWHVRVISAKKRNTSAGSVESS
jgi:hypothetical protein